MTCTATNTAGLSRAGSFTVSVAAPLAAGTTTCNGVYGGSGTSVNVPAGGTCVLVAGATLTGNVTVGAGGSLRTIKASVAGSVSLQGATASMLCGLSVGQNLSVANAPPGPRTIVVGDTAAGCGSGDTISGNVSITGNQAPVDLGSSTIGTTGKKPNGGRVTATGNTALLTFRGDTIAVSLDVSGPGPVVIIDCTVAGRRIG